MWMGLGEIWTLKGGQIKGFKAAEEGFRDKREWGNDGKGEFGEIPCLPKKPLKF